MAVLAPDLVQLFTEIVGDLLSRFYFEADFVDSRRGLHPERNAFELQIKEHGVAPASHKRHLMEPL